MIITFLVVALAYLPRAHAAEPPPKTAIQQNTTQQAPNLANPATSTATQGPAATQNQTIKIAGTSYATGVRLGLPIAVLIRAKALSEKANQQTLKTAGN